jgi:hypothetical protein
VNAVQVIAVRQAAVIVYEHAQAVRDCASPSLRLQLPLLMCIADMNNSSIKHQLDRCCQHIQYDFAPNSKIEVVQHNSKSGVFCAATDIRMIVQCATHVVRYSP